uniref:Uncharacterized protein n=1 Tax=Anguilla anguilla TaxID=7936 RepID=A0A0E9PDJ7_ANGAN
MSTSLQSVGRGTRLPPFCLHHRAFEKTLSKVEIEQESLKALSF